MKNEITITEDLDFHYLLSLLPPLESCEEFSFLPELFSILGADSIVKLCKYCGGETIKIPTLDQLQKSIDALQFFYDCYIKKSKESNKVPKEIKPIVDKILSVYNA